MAAILGGDAGSAGDFTHCRNPWKEREIRIADDSAGIASVHHVFIGVNGCSSAADKRPSPAAKSKHSQPPMDAGSRRFMCKPIGQSAWRQVSTLVAHRAMLVKERDSRR